MILDPPPKVGYGALRPQTAPAGKRAARAAESAHLYAVAAGEAPPPGTFPDPRHLGDSPMPWLRYFFPRDFDQREGVDENPFYQFFDVHAQSFEEDIAVKPPAWSPNAFFRLSFTQQGEMNQDIANRKPDLRSPLDAIDFTQNNWPVFHEEAQAHLENVLSFCRSCASFQARTWKDAFPLVDLLRGLLLYLMDQMLKGQKLAEEYAKRNYLQALEADRRRFADEYAAKLAEEQEMWRKTMEERILAAREESRAQALDEAAVSIAELKAEIEQWQTKCGMLELQLKKANETIAGLQRQMEGLQSHLETEKAAHSRNVLEKQNELRRLIERERELEDALANTRRVIASALKARTKKEVMAVATAAISSTLLGSHAYVAELRTADAMDSVPEGSALKEIQELAKADPAGVFAQGLAKIGTDFVLSPLGPSTFSERMEATASSKPPTLGAAATIAEGKEGMKEGLMLKYVAASEKNQFMVGQSLPYAQGVSWGLVEGAREVTVPDLLMREGVHFFRGAPARGSYFAVPILGNNGEMMGLLGVDSIGMQKEGDAGTPTEHIGYEEGAFIREIATIIANTVSADQSALDQLIVQALILNEPEPEEEEVEVLDPEKYADMNGGLKLFRDALNMLKGMSDDELESFKSGERPDDVTIAVIRSILSAAGERSENDWEQIKGLLTRDLIDRLSAMDPTDSQLEWKELCKHLQAVSRVESEYGNIEDQMANKGAFARALGNWLSGVRKISAANAFKIDLDKKLAKSNMTLMKLFSGDGSNHLTELRSYRIPPKITFSVLQCILLLGGCSEDDVHNWGRMKVMTKYSLIKQLTELKPSSVSASLIKKVDRVVSNIDEDDVKKESAATLALFKWMANFIKVSLLHLNTIA